MDRRLADGEWEPRWTATAASKVLEGLKDAMRSADCDASKAASGCANSGCSRQVDRSRFCALAEPGPVANSYPL